MSRNEFGIPVLTEQQMTYIASNLDPMLAARLANGQDFLEALWDVYTEARDFELVERGQVPACSQGCQSCCHQTFLVTRIEFDAMIGGFDQLGPQDRYRVKRKAQSLARAWNKYLESKAKGRGLYVTDINDFKRMILEFGALEEVKCPFISQQDGSCLIYTHRPFECRACQSAVACNSRGGKPIHSVCDFWPGGVLAEKEMQLYGAVTMHPLPHWFSNSNRF